MRNLHCFEMVVKCRHMECEEKFKKIVTDEVLKLSRFNSSILDGKVIIQKSSGGVEVDISLRLPKFTIVSVHEDYNHLSAFDGALKKSKVQLKKIREKITDHRVANNKPIIPTDTESV